MVKVELIEEKPKYPPYVLVEDTLGHDAYHDPEDHQPTVKTERLRSPKKQQTKIAQSKPTAFRMKAPEHQVDRLREVRPGIMVRR